MIIQINDLYKRFGEKEVLQGIQFEVQSGKALGLLGRNGAGKTTTIRIIMGVFPADSGEVLLDGAPINREKTAIGYLPEEHGLYPKISINDQLLYLAELRGMRKKEAKSAISYWLGRLEMEQYGPKKLDTLSKGNQQKIQLAAALVNNPDFVILDEPFSGLDPVNAALLKDVVKELIASGKVVLFSSHQMNYVEEFCDSVAVLHHGKIVLSGEIDTIKRSYDRSVLEIATGDGEELSEFCRSELSGLITSATTQKGTVSVKLVAENCKGEFIEKLSRKRFDIDSIRVFEPSLNDIFVKTVGDETGKEGETV